MRGFGAVALVLLGCASSRAGLDDLPAQPIAFVYRSVEETQRVVDEVEARAAAERAAAENKLDLRLDRLEKLAGARTEKDLLRDQQGQLALFVAPERRLDHPASLPRGARPLDWSPERRLMFSWKQREMHHLFEWDPGTDQIRQLTSGSGAQIAGCYGPGGAIAWVQVEGTSARIWIRRAGEAARSISSGPLDTQPSWSSTAGRIVFTATDANGGTQLRWVDPLEGTGGSYGPGRSARFSPDGEWIVYSARTAVGWRLRRMHADGSGKRGLGTSGYEESAPSFSPDGRFVVFSATKDEASPLSRLFVRSFDGSADRQLEFAGSGLLPVW